MRDDLVDLTFGVAYETVNLGLLRNFKHVGSVQTRDPGDGMAGAQQIALCDIEILLMPDDAQGFFLSKHDVLLHHFLCVPE